MKQMLRKIHRWLGLFMALQIVAWMASGLWFTIFPIAEIRGEHLTRPATELSLQRLDAVAGLSAVQQALDLHFGDEWTLSEARLTGQDGRVLWRVAGRTGGRTFNRLVESDGGRVMPMLTAAAAEQRARSWLLESAQPQTAEWIEKAAPGSEIRGRDLPLWKVSFAEPESLHLYLDPWTGEIVARRTQRWRIFDFFWMLHIMDFEARENFSHPVLQIAAVLGLITALSGVALWLVTASFRRRRPA